MDVKNKMYNYETPPPGGVWEAIAAELDRNEALVIPITKKKNYTFYYLAAASVALLLFSIFFFTNRSSTPAEKQIVSSPNEIENDSVITGKVLITVPIEEKASVKNREVVAQNKIQKSNPDQKQTKPVKNTDAADEKVTASNESRYLTIEGNQGQPVKISSKMATLIDSSETKISSKPIWNKKINEWKEIMKANTLAPTPGNFLDIIELTKSVKDNK